MNILDTHGHLILPEPNSGCWLWVGYINDNGYGEVRHKGLLIKAHRLSWLLYNGSISDYILHKCDVRCCVNPEHLFDGTLSDNVVDSMLKGRWIMPDFKGESNGQSKLSEDQVLMIRNDTRLNKHIAKEFNISASLVGKIKRKILWRWL